MRPTCRSLSLEMTRHSFSLSPFLFSPKHVNAHLHVYTAEARKVTSKAIAEKKEAEMNRMKVEDEFKEEKQLTFAVTTNMTRQYKGTSYTH